jgi:hypothetical protein
MSRAAQAPTVECVWIPPETGTGLSEAVRRAAECAFGEASVIGIHESTIASPGALGLSAADSEELERYLAVNRTWHIDGSYHEVAPALSLLHAVRCGSDRRTEFRSRVLNASIGWLAGLRPELVAHQQAGTAETLQDAGASLRRSITRDPLSGKHVTWLGAHELAGTESVGGRSKIRTAVLRRWQSRQPVTPVSWSPGLMAVWSNHLLEHRAVEGAADFWFEGFTITVPHGTDDRA